jgi:hypothetical protein
VDALWNDWNRGISACAAGAKMGDTAYRTTPPKPMMADVDIHAEMI